MISRDQFGEFPNVIGEIRFHGGCDTQGFVNSAKIVVGEVQTVRGPKVFPLFGKRIRQAGKAAHGHADREILAFHNRGADAFGIGLSDNWDHLRRCDFGGAVAAFVALRSAVDLDELREVCAIFKGVHDGRFVRRESVRRNLERIRSGSMTKSFNKDISRGLIAASQGEVENQLRIAFDGNKAVGVPYPFIVRFLYRLVAFLLADESPNFIALDIFHRNVHDQAPHQCVALLTGGNEDFHDRVDVEIGNALRAPQAVTFDQQPKGEHDAILRDIGAFERGLVGFRVGLLAERATKTAKTVAMFAEALTSSIARSASHCFGGFFCGLHTFYNTAYGSCLSTQISIPMQIIFLFFSVGWEIDLWCGRRVLHPYAPIRMRRV
jgi:hypothetical protein